MALKILILTPRIPYPLKDGGSMAMYQSIEQYVKQGCEVSVLSMNTLKHWLDEDLLPPLFKKLHFFKSIRVDTDIQKVDSFINLFTKKSYNVNRFVSKEYKTALLELLEENSYDAIQFESIYTAPYLSEVKQVTKSLCVCRVHNIECELWKRLATHEKQLFKRSYLKLLTQRLRKFEIDALNRFDLLLPISALEKDKLTLLDINTPTYYVPYCLDVHTHEQEKHTLDVNSIYHIGSMDWQPNLEGIHWFLDNCWEEITLSFPFLYFYLGGRNMPGYFHNLKIHGIEVIGEIENATDFHLEKNICIIPLQSGAGVRIKVLEAMSLGKTIISTPVGCEGIEVEDGKNILIANSAEEFIVALKLCFANKEKCIDIGKEAKKFIEEEYSFNKIYSSLIHFIKGKIKHG
jgi:glycosyltransferase involved in cell wall biosynthesis